MRRQDIAGMRRRRDVEGLIGALTDPDENTRLMAAQALGYVGDARALEPLERLKFSDQNVDVRRAASQAHAQVADRLAMEQLARGR